MPLLNGSSPTYARRYSLFTLVGIAGEDDLDAPDLPIIHLKDISAARDQSDKINGRAESGTLSYIGPKAKSWRHKIVGGTTPLALSPDQSAALRNRLLSEVTALSSADNAATWARDGLTAKNSLTGDDAKQ